MKLNHGIVRMDHLLSFIRMHSNRIILALGTIAVVGALFFGVSFFFGAPTINEPPTTINNEPKQFTVAASTTVLTEFATNVGGGSIQLITVAPEGIGAHDFEPLAQDIAELQTVDLFIMHGAGLDAWAERLRPSLEEQGVEVLVITEGMQLRDAVDEPVVGEEEEETDVSGDPHVWLDPILAQQMVTTIRDQFIALNPTQAETYTENAAAYRTQLEQLHQSFKAGLAQCSSRTLIVAHDAFGYLADRYDLEVLPIAGISPESEPSARHLAQLSDIARAKGVTTIFFETLTSPTLANTLAAEVGAQTNVLNPFEGLTSEERIQGKTYVTVMQENLNNISAALNCQSL